MSWESQIVEVEKALEVAEQALIEADSEIKSLKSEIERLNRIVKRQKDEIYHVKNSFRYRDGDALNNAAGNLPKNYKLVYTIFGDGDGDDIELFNPAGKDITPELSDELFNQVESCIECAKNEVKS